MNTSVNTSDFNNELNLLMAVRERFTVTRYPSKYRYLLDHSFHGLDIDFLAVETASVATVTTIAETTTITETTIAAESSSIAESAVSQASSIAAIKLSSSEGDQSHQEDEYS